MQMAMITAAIANDGKLMQPYVVDEVRGPDLGTLQKTEPSEMSQAVSPETAQKVQEMMEFTAKEGSAQKAQIDGITLSCVAVTISSRKLPIAAPPPPPLAMVDGWSIDHSTLSQSVQPV